MSYTIDAYPEITKQTSKKTGSIADVVGGFSEAVFGGAPSEPAPSGGYSQTVFGSEPVKTSSFNWSAYIEPAREAANAVLDFQMKQALLTEQRDRVSVGEGVYVPSTIDAENASFTWPWSDKPAAQGINPMYIGGAALIALLLLRKRR